MQIQCDSQSHMRDVYWIRELGALVALFLRKAVAPFTEAF